MVQQLDNTIQWFLHSRKEKLELVRSKQTIQLELGHMVDRSQFAHCNSSILQWQLVLEQCSSSQFQVHSSR